MCVSPQLALPDLRGGSYQQLAGFLGIFSYRSSPTITTRVESKSNTLDLVVLGLCQPPAEVELDGSVGWNWWGGPPSQSWARLVISSLQLPADSLCHCH